MAQNVLLVRKLSENASTPKYGSSHAAGLDIAAAQDVIVPARSHKLIKTDISIEFPSGHYARSAPRSGLSYKFGIQVGAGVIDEDYRGNIGVILFNHSDVPFEVTIGDRIAQLILEKISRPDVKLVDDLNESERQESGFGSTGLK